MAAYPQVMFRPALWSTRAGRAFSEIGDAGPHELAIFEAQARSKEWPLYEVYVEGEAVGFVLWSVEVEGNDTSININAAAARPVAGVDITRAIVLAFTGLAEKMGSRAVRCWTVREGLRRKLENMGARSRYVMEIEINGR